MTEPHLIDVRETARRLGVDSTTIRSLAAYGILTNLREGTEGKQKLFRLFSVTQVQTLKRVYQKRAPYAYLKTRMEEETKAKIERHIVETARAPMVPYRPAKAAKAHSNGHSPEALPAPLPEAPRLSQGILSRLEAIEDRQQQILDTVNQLLKVWL